MRDICRAVGRLAVLGASLAGLLTLAQGPQTNSSATQNGVDLFKQGRYAEAKVSLAKAVAASPEDATAKAYLGMTIHNFDRDYDGAMNLLEEAVKLRPQLPLPPVAGGRLREQGR